jgi:cytochrome c-type biogenesis protein CcmH/NrfG
MALWRGGRPLEALAAFDSALRFDPSNVSALVWMGSILLDAGRADEALDHFALATRRDPTLADAFVGIALVMVQRRQFADAEGALRRAETIDAANPRIIPARARLESARAGRGSRP